MKRTEIREHVFKLVFSCAFNCPEELSEQMGMYFKLLDETEVEDEDREYIINRAMDVFKKKDALDALINSHTKGWRTERMNKVDLSILRLALYEMRWDSSVPEKVAINEAVELAKKYSGEEGPSFINGVLANLTESPSPR